MSTSKTKQATKPMTSKKTASASARKRNRRLVNFKEAAGKTIRSIEHKTDVEDGIWTLELKFTDNTLFYFDIDARPRVRAEYMRDDNGDLELLRAYDQKAINECQ